MAQRSSPAAVGHAKLRSRLRAALRGWRVALIGSLGWGLAMMVSAQASLWLRTAGVTDHFWSLSLLYFSGAFLAWPVALYLIRLTSLARGFEPRLAASLLFLTVATIVVTACVFALHYRLFYAQWHGAAFGRLWLIQFIFTFVAALYQFAVMGLRLYLPFGALFLMAAALWLSWRPGAAGRRETGIRRRLSTD
ncbi:hypothetical protein [Pseudohoeflea coraliihabitans]|uniref:Uncharacterized protein n=1 Tax=Pseudohoeflea coraliihabitans TaxID=2860393 RepID=A0ABS6WSD4_9HYPH|nr:hypothetical protein [Pseudohoeflea sp. DP4N28-3]MBW3098845.1 hypothetical protein [Pseudohoeflea sp. DP4N28-3]